MGHTAANPILKIKLVRSIEVEIFGEAIKPIGQE